MPLNVATFAPERAARVMTRFADIRHWVIAGHGLGGVAAAAFASQHEGELAGLMLWGAAPGLFTDLSHSQIPVLSVSGTGDIPTAPADIARSRERLPATTTFVAIQGGDRLGFANFATERSGGLVPRERQQAATLSAAQSFLERLSGMPADDGGS